MEITKWEIEYGNSAEKIEKLGQKGWEPFGVQSNGVIMFKRPCGRLKVIEKVNGVEINNTQTEPDQGIDR